MSSLLLSTVPFPFRESKFFRRQTFPLLFPCLQFPFLDMNQHLNWFCFISCLLVKFLLKNKNNLAEEGPLLFAFLFCLLSCGIFLKNFQISEYNYFKVHFIPPFVFKDLGSLYFPSFRKAILREAKLFTTIA